MTASLFFRTKAILGAAILLAVVTGATHAAATPSLSYIAASDIVGKTSTGTVFSGGNPAYLGLAPQYRGVVGLSFFEGGSEYVCSGSLSANRMYIITAGHCGYNASNATAYFYNPGPDTNAAYGYETPVYVAGAPNVTTVGVSNIYVNPTYTADRNADPGDVVDDNDIAVYKLASAAPAFAQGYSLYYGGDLTGLDFNTAGYGTRSTNPYAPANGGTGRLRQGDNSYVFRLGDPDFDGLFTDPSLFGPNAADDYIAELDDGTYAHDQACQLGVTFSTSGNVAKYCTLGGPTQVLTAPGDSGGPQFVDGKLASITSFGLTFGTEFGDVDDSLDSTIGELAGYVPVSHNLAFLDSVLGIPEPASWAMMLIGFGVLGGAARKRRALTA